MSKYGYIYKMLNKWFYYMELEITQFNILQAMQFVSEIISPYKYTRR